MAINIKTKTSTFWVIEINFSNYNTIISIIQNNKTDIDNNNNNYQL